MPMPLKQGVVFLLYAGEPTDVFALPCPSLILCPTTVTLCSAFMIDKKSAAGCSRNDTCALQVRFFEVSEDKLEKQRAAFSSGQLSIKIEEEQFSMR